ncbi:MAG TPA: hypothetical protein VEG29_04335 [Candidatus Binatia bacterium]|nr:hypothetical protein [Candidatus Binatia bacterium]
MNGWRSPWPRDGRVRSALLALLAIIAVGGLALVGAGDVGNGPGGALIEGSLGSTAGIGEAATSGSSLAPGMASSGTASDGPSARPGTTPKAGPTPRPAGTPATAKATPQPTPRPTPKPIAPRALTACPMFPASNVWNRRVDSLPVASDSDAMIAAIGLGSHLHPDFGSYSGYGIPYNVVGTSTPRSKVKFQYASESDKVGYPIPAKPKIEGGSDRHLLMVDTNACKLYELYDAVKTSSGWKAGSGAVWNLRSNALRPNGWTSADAAGLPILPGLVRYDEVARGAILHALRFTAPSTCSGHIYPARHDAGSGSCTAEPPMGLRVRLKASVSLAGYGTQAKILLTALKRYGMILADNGSPWYVTGAPDPHWNDDVLHAIGQLSGDDFEVVDTSGFVNGG